MKTAVLSGKGGTGKTLTAVNLAAAAENAVYLDCDVEEPNGRLFLKPVGTVKTPVCSPLPVFDEKKCAGCKKCVSACRFNALVYVKGKPSVFPEVCHSCGLCLEVCPTGAISEAGRETGSIETGTRGGVKVITGELNYGEASGVPVIRAVKKAAEADRKAGKLIIADCPPGSACSVTESIEDADFCILVTEPTAFGLHNLRTVHALTRLLDIKAGVVINKVEEPYKPLEDFCADSGLPVLARLPYSKKYAGLISKGELLSESCPELKSVFLGILKKAEGAV